MDWWPVFLVVGSYYSWTTSNICEWKWFSVVLLLLVHPPLDRVVLLLLVRPPLEREWYAPPQLFEFPGSFTHSPAL